MKRATQLPKTEPARPGYRVVAARIRAARQARSLDQSAVARALET